MIGESSQISHLTKFSNTFSIFLADASFSSVLGQGVIYPFPLSSFKLNSILYVLKFPINLLSISQFTKQFNCVAIFFPPHCVFQDLYMNRMIGGGLEQDGLYYLDSRFIF